LFYKAFLFAGLAWKHFLHWFSATVAPQMTCPCVAGLVGHLCCTKMVWSIGLTN